MKALTILFLMSLVSCSGVALKQTKPDGYVYENGLPECSWSRPFTKCESKDQVKPLWTACPAGSTNIWQNSPTLGRVYCVPDYQVRQPAMRTK